MIMVVAAFLLLFAAAGLWAMQAWSGLMQARGIEGLDWHRAEMSVDGVSLERLSFVWTDPSHPLSARAEGLTVSWDWQGLVPRLQNIRLQRLTLETGEMKEAGRQEADSTGRLALADVLDPQRWASRVPAWLPVSVSVKDLQLHLPCRSGQCPLSGSLALQRSQTGLPVRANLLLRHQGRMLVLYGEANRNDRNTLDLALSLGMEGETVLQAETIYQPSTRDGIQSLQGSVRVPDVPAVGGLLAWLNHWAALPFTELPGQPGAATVEASWSLTADDGQPLPGGVTGSVSMNGSLARPWQIPQLGALKGDVRVSLMVTDGRWEARTAHADLALTDPDSWVTQIPPPLRPESITLKVRPGQTLPDAASEQALPLAFTATSRGRGSVNVNWQGELQLAPRLPLTLRLRRSRLQADLPRYQMADWVARELNADLALTGLYSEESREITLAPDSRLRIKHLDHRSEPLWLDGLEADLSAIEIALPESSAGTLPGITGRYRIRADDIHHPLLTPQSWSLAGQLRHQGQSLASDARLQAQSGAQADLQLDWPEASAAQLSASVQASGDGVNDLLRVFAGWPAAASVEEGELQADARLTLPPEPVGGGEGPSPEIRGSLELRSLAGLHDRVAWSGLSGTLGFSQQNNRLTASLPDLTLQQVNPGVVFGPIAVAARYEADRDSPMAGLLTLDKARSAALGGDVTVPSMTLDLKNRPLRVPLVLEGIELSRVMSVYPAEGLAGTGTLKGQVPLVVAASGVRVDGGRMSAIDPGGTLQLPADRIRALGQNNQALAMVAGALENFHYSVLDSTIDYRQDGTLQLGLNLHGRNPELPESPPVVLNISLEEDIPALLTSLQLSGRVNEAVTDRVRELLRQREQAQ